MMTVISLVYSLTLIVFTLAAANIGPRLLETFATNRVNQITIGLLGATFLYALICLYITGEHEVPRFSVALAIFFAAACFFWLVYFVHDVARRIMVDNEIGRTRQALRESIERLLAEEPREEPLEESSIPDSAPVSVAAHRSGYVMSVDIPTLIERTVQGKAFVKLEARPGDFIIEGAPIAQVYDCDDLDIIAEGLKTSIVIGDSRSPDGDVQFSIHLMVEIALRALSPGVNDSYTAISAIDHLSAALSLILQKGAPSSLYRDEQDRPRLWLDLISVDDIFAAALHPLRQAVEANVFVTLRLLWALERISQIADPQYRSILARHLRLIAEDANRSVANRADRSEIAENVARVRQTLQNR